MSINILFKGRVVTALIMFAVFLIMTGMAFSFPEKARLMPLMIGIPGVILGFAQLIMEIRTALTEAIQEPKEGIEQERKDELQMLLWIFLFFIFILCFGFIYASPLLVAGFLYVAKSESLKTAIIGGIATWAVLYGFFETWFQIPLFPGLVQLPQ